MRSESHNHVRPRRGLFVGLATLDVVYRVRQFPRADEKIVALSQELCGGGPALNAAVTFAALGGEATLVTSVGCHVLAEQIKSDLAACHVHLVDLTPTLTETPVCATVLVNEEGQRIVVSLGAITSGTAPPTDEEIHALIGANDVMLFDGHHPLVALAFAQMARSEARSMPLILDAGSWKPVLEFLLPHIDHVVASARMTVPSPPGEHQPGTQAWQTAILENLAMRAKLDARIIMTRGSDTVLELTGPHAMRTIDLPAGIKVVDTLGAGDVFHGAYAFAQFFNDEAQFRFQSMHAIWLGSCAAGIKISHYGQRAWLGDERLIQLRRFAVSRVQGLGSDMRLDYPLCPLGEPSCQEWTC